MPELAPRRSSPVKCSNIRKASTSLQCRLAVQRPPSNRRSPAHTPIAFTVITPAVPQVKEGNLRALAVTTSKRSSALPDVPTLAEAGLAHQESDTILGVLVPAQTPQPIVALLHREIRNAMNEPDVAEKLASLGFETIASTPDEFFARIRDDVPKWTRIIRAADVKVE